MNLHPMLEEQLLKCRPNQVTKEEPVSAVDMQGVSGQQEDVSAGEQEAPAATYVAPAAPDCSHL
eukprot:12925027-Prorocentrum_lima.AAC.1